MQESLVNTQLIENLKSGSAEAFDTLYFTYYRIVYANIFKLIQHEQNAEEMLQDVFVALWENKHKIDPMRPVLGWLVTVSYNKSVNFLHKQIKERLVTGNSVPGDIPEIITEDNYAIEQQLEILYAIIEQLPARKRQVYTMCKLEGKTMEETASLLGISISTVKEHVHFASRFIKAHALEKYADVTLTTTFCYFLMP